MTEIHPRIKGAVVKARIAAATLMAACLVSGSLLADEWGVLSSNAADNPPEVNPDWKLRSTDPDRPPAYGPEDALVLIVLFSDYRCPACRRANPATHQIATEFPGEVRIEVWQRPLAMHPGADDAAKAALAAQRQGKFWEMHDLLYENFGRTGPADLERYAMSLDLDMEQFRADMNDPEIQARIQREHDLAEELDAKATPGWLVNGRVSVGWGSWRGFRLEVEHELNASRALAREGLSPAEVREQRAISNYENSETFELYRTNVLLQEPDAVGGAGSP